MKVKSYALAGDKEKRVPGVPPMLSYTRIICKVRVMPLRFLCPVCRQNVSPVTLRRETGVIS